MRLVVVSNRSKPILTSLSSGWAHTVCVASDVAFAQSLEMVRAMSVPSAAGDASDTDDDRLTQNSSPRELDAAEEKLAVSRGEMAPQYVFSVVPMLLFCIVGCCCRC